MSTILSSLKNTVTAGFIVTVLLLIVFMSWGSVSSDSFSDQAFYSFLFRWLHVLSGIMWIGLLWYFNFVQIPNMPNIPDDQKPAVTKVIAPKVLFWFRYAALATILSGLIVAYLNGYLHQSMTLGIGDGGGKNTAIGIGMWLGIIMAYNVWFIIWPNQKKVLGIVEADTEEKLLAGKKAMLTSRVNTLLSIPMLLTMVAAQNLY